MAPGGGDGGNGARTASELSSPSDVRVDVPPSPSAHDDHAATPGRHGHNVSIVPDLPDLSPPGAVNGRGGSDGRLSKASSTASRRPTLDKSLSTVGKRIEESVRFDGNRPKGMTVSFTVGRVARLLLRSRE